MTADLIDQLDRIIDRIVRNDAVLVLERESEQWWVVVDRANQDEVMMRADRELCIRFMRAFVVKHPEASFALPERGECEAGVAQQVERPQSHTGKVASSSLVPGLVPPNPGMPRSESVIEHSWRVAQAAADIADSPHGNVTVAEACEKLASVLPFRGAS